MKDQQLLKEPTVEVLVLDKPIDGWLFVLPSDMAEEVPELSRWQQLRQIGANKIESIAKVVRGH